MIVRNLDIERMATLPFEADAPLPVDSNAVLALAFTFPDLGWNVVHRRPNQDNDPCRTRISRKPDLPIAL